MNYETKIMENEGKKIIIMAGDFNFPNLDWKLIKSSGGTRNLNREADDLMDFSDKFFFTSVY